MLNFVINPSKQACKNFNQKKCKIFSTNKRLVRNYKKKNFFFIICIFFLGFLTKKIPEKHAPRFSGLISEAKFSKKNLYEKLAQIPVFAVTNSTGQPYLTNNSKGEQIGLIFFSHEDALALLKAMQNSHQVSDARIYIMGLDKAYKMVTSNIHTNETKTHQTQEFKMVFRFYPNQKQLKNANQICKKKSFFGEKIENIPVFIAEGLTVQKGKENIVPLFLTKEDLEKAWLKMIPENPDINSKPVILVADLIKIIELMEKNTKEHCKFGFFPPHESIEFAKKENKINPSARIYFSGKF